MSKFLFFNTFASGFQGGIMLYNEVKMLLKKEFLLEWRQKYALNGMLLYVVSTVMICYLSFRVKPGQLNPITWNALFWIIMLFTAVNAVAKSFMQEKSSRLVYYYTIASPQGIILSKVIYNVLLMLVLGITGFIIYSIVLGNPVANISLFLVNLFLGAIGFANALTLVSGIAAKAGNNTSLMAILSFPVIIPILLLIIKVSKNAMDGLLFSASLDDILVLLAINLIVSTVSFLLFPYLWRT